MADKKENNRTEGADRFQGTRSCRCLEAMLQGFRKSYYRDADCMYIVTESEKEENVDPSPS